MDRWNLQQGKLTGQILEQIVYQPTSGTLSLRDVDPVLQEQVQKVYQTCLARSLV
jgi:hypothetical protein